MLYGTISLLLCLFIFKWLFYTYPLRNVLSFPGKPKIRKWIKFLSTEQFEHKLQLPKLFSVPWHTHGALAVFLRSSRGCHASSEATIILWWKAPVTSTLALENLSISHLILQKNELALEPSRWEVKMHSIKKKCIFCGRNCLSLFWTDLPYWDENTSQK